MRADRATHSGDDFSSPQRRDFSSRHAPQKLLQDRARAADEPDGGQIRYAFSNEA
jgi:hypothetical protein